MKRVHPKDDYGEVPAKLRVYGHIVQDQHGTTIQRSPVVFLTEDVCFSKANTFLLDGEGNIQLEMEETESPSPYEIAKLCLCILTERVMKELEDRYDSNKHQPQRSDLRNLIEEVVTKLNNPSIKIDNRTADTAHSLLPQAGVVKIIKNPPLLFTTIKETCNM